MTPLSSAAGLAGSFCAVIAIRGARSEGRVRLILRRSGDAAKAEPSFNSQRRPPARRTERQAASLTQTAALKTPTTGAKHASDVVASADDNAEEGVVVVKPAAEATDAISSFSEQIGRKSRVNASRWGLMRGRNCRLDEQESRIRRRVPAGAENTVDAKDGALNRHRSAPSRAQSGRPVYSRWTSGQFAQNGRGVV